MTVKEVIKVLSLVDENSEVMLNNPDWSYKDKECFISSVTYSGKGVSLNFDSRTLPEQCNGDEDRSE